MKRILLLSAIIAVSIGTAAAQGAAGVIIKQRAKELVNQNNVRQGVPTPAPPAKPAVPPGQAASPAATLKQQNIARLQADIAAIAGKAQTPAELKQRFGKDLLAGAQGLSKPSGATIAKFVDSFSATLASRAVETSEQARLAQDLNAICDCGNLDASRVKAILDDVQAILQVSGVKRSEALGVVSSLRAIASEVQHAPTR